MTFDPKYLVFKTVRKEELQDSTLKDWNLLEVLEEEVLEQVTESVANPTPRHENTNNMGVYQPWTPMLSEVRVIKQKVVLFLLGQTEGKLSARYGELKESLLFSEKRADSATAESRSLSASTLQARAELAQAKEQERRLLQDVTVLKQAFNTAKALNLAFQEEQLEFRTRISKLLDTVRTLEKQIPIKPEGPIRKIEIGGLETE